MCRLGPRTLKGYAPRLHVRDLWKLANCPKERFLNMFTGSFYHWKVTSGPSSIKTKKCLVNPFNLSAKFIILESLPWHLHDISPLKTPRPFHDRKIAIRFWLGNTRDRGHHGNKKVLLLERKRHAARCIASSPSAVLSWGYPIHRQGYPHPDLARGVPHPWGVPCPGLPLSWPGWGVPHPWTGVGIPHHWTGGAVSWPG